MMVKTSFNKKNTKNLLFLHICIKNNIRIIIMHIRLLQTQGAHEPKSPGPHTWLSL
jgi:hypothetical protein